MAAAAAAAEDDTLQIVPMAETLFQQTFDPDEPFSPMGAVSSQLAHGMHVLKSAKQVAKARGVPDDSALMVIVAHKADNKKRAMEIMRSCATLATTSREHMQQLVAAFKRDMSSETAAKLLRSLIETMGALSDIVVRESKVNLQTAQELEAEIAKVAPEFEELRAFLARAVRDQARVVPGIAEGESKRLDVTRRVVSGQ